MSSWARGVERIGIEPVPAHLQRMSGVDLFGLLFMGNVNAVMMMLGALAVTVGGLPFWHALLAMTLGQALASLGLVVIGQIGADHGLSGQIALRATFGLRGSRFVTSPYRVAVACYWFAAQNLAAALGVTAIVSVLVGYEMDLVHTGVILGVAQAILGIAGLHTMRLFARMMLPSTALFVGAIVLILASESSVGTAHASDSTAMELSFSWGSFVIFTSVFWGGAASNVTNIPDLCRYARSRRAVRAGVGLGSVTGTIVGAGLGAYVATLGIVSANPFSTIASAGSYGPLLIVLACALIIQATSINALNLYTGGLSLANSIPRLGRLRATAIVSMAGVLLATAPGVIFHAHRWVIVLGGLATPLMGVVLTDYVLYRRMTVDTAALFDPSGRYAFWRGVNPAAVLGTALGALAYTLAPESYLRAAWGLVVAGIGYAALRQLGLGLDREYDASERARA